MARHARLDAELVRRGLARSRDHAGDLIAAGRVSVSGTVAAKPATGVSTDTPLLVAPAPTGAAEYVSRGGHKLAGALTHFGEVADHPLVVSGKRCLDAGASTGGFTDVLLRAGAAHVVGVDVGYGQLAWSLRTDDRVTVIERTNVRSLEADQIDGQVELTVGDLSFISLRTVLPALAACTRPDGDFVLLVKPQFEVGRDQLGKGGIVRDPALRASSVVSVAAAARTLGLGVRGAVASSLPGPQGNVEYLLWLTGPTAPCPEPQDAEAYTALAERAVAEGPA
jgi:23S rRNA (cytidine1920-2'-O)/16S rRNA (cytidine1409-2'-O)-methyltransferase